MLEGLFAHPDLLDLLLSFLQHKPPLNPASAGYFRKVVVVLIQRKHAQVSLSLLLICMQTIPLSPRLLSPPPPPPARTSRSPVLMGPVWFAGSWCATFKSGI
jgi:hypothetical protein